MKLFKIIRKISFLLLIIKPVLAHVEHAEPSVSKEGLLYKIFLLHDWIHPIFFILMIHSCYYFRIFSSKKISKHPSTCLGECRSCYRQEGKLKQYHRYLFWVTFILTIIHVGEILPSIKTFLSTTGLDLWILLSETTYLASAFFYLVTCYHFRYFVERGAKRGLISYKLYNKLTALNRSHGVFFWVTIIIVLIRFTLVVIDTGSIIKAIPGTF